MREGCYLWLVTFVRRKGIEVDFSQSALVCIVELYVRTVLGSWLPGDCNEHFVVVVEVYCERLWILTYGILQFGPLAVVCEEVNIFVRNEKHVIV